MQLLVLATLLTSILCQQGIIRTDGWSLDMRRFNECVRVDGRAISAYTSQGVEIELYRGTECGSGPYYYTGGGNYNFPRPVEFQSAWIVRRRNRRNSQNSVQSDGSQAAEGEGFGGEESGSSTKLEARSYYSP